MEIVQERQVFWVNATVPDDPEFNDRFAAFANKHPNLHIVDWVSVSADHPEYFFYDNIHVMEEGCEVLADLIYDDIYNYYLTKYKNEKDQMIADIKAQINSRIAFYGNDALIYSYNDLYAVYDKAAYYTDRNYTFNDIYAELKQMKEAEALEHKLVLLFDSSMQISRNQYLQIIDLLPDHELYVVLLDDDYQFNRDNVTIIDMYSLIKDDPSYLNADGIHLTEAGNLKLKELLSEKLH